MATATKKTQTVITAVILELSEAEASTLSRFLYKTGGFDPVAGHRSRLNSIGRVLRECGFDPHFEQPAIGIGHVFECEGVPDVTFRRTVLMQDDLSIEQKRLILEAGFDSHRLRKLELEHPELCIYTVDSVRFDQIWSDVVEYDNRENETDD